jgi:hypothetical protein
VFIKDFTLTVERGEKNTEVKLENAKLLQEFLWELLLSFTLTSAKGHIIICS